MSTEGSVWDVAVVGAGPAGALAARQIARAGLRVLLVEQDRLPRDKVCGCCLSARGIETLAACHLSHRLASLGPRSYDALRLAASGAEARIPLPGGVTIDRACLDAMLVEAAASAGATVLDQTRAVLESLHSSVDDLRRLHLSSRGGRGPSRTQARVVVLAAGIANRVAIPDLDDDVVRTASRIGVSTTLDAAEPVPWADDAINMAVARAGYVGAARLEDGRWRVAAALDRRELHTSGRVSPLVRRVLESAGWSAPQALTCTAWRGTPALWRHPRRVAARRLFVIGDAAGYVEPFTGEGIACALDAGRAVAELAVRAAAHWSDSLIDAWTETVTRRVQRGWRAAAVAAHVVRQPVLTAATTGLLSRYPGLASPAVAYLNRSREESAS